MKPKVIFWDDEIDELPFGWWKRQRKKKRGEIINITNKGEGIITHPTDINKIEKKYEWPFLVYMTTKTNGRNGKSEHLYIY